MIRADRLDQLVDQIRHERTTRDYCQHGSCDKLAMPDGILCGQHQAEADGADSRPDIPIFHRLLPLLRAKAKELGYAIGVHGSMKRDLDLIACPWTSTAVDPKTLAEALRATAAENNGGIAFMTPLEAEKEWFQNGCQPYGKPHGRLQWSFHLGGGPYIDLAVMPRLIPPE